MGRRVRQLDLDLRETPRWGGRRAGAGRKRGPGSERSAPRASATRGAFSLPRHAEGEERPAVSSIGQARARAQLRRGVRTRAIPSRSLLHPERSSACNRRSDERARSRERNEIDRFSAREGCEPSVPAARTGPRGSLPPPCLPNAARGTARDRVLPSECASPPLAKMGRLLPPAAVDPASSGRFFSGWNRRFQPPSSHHPPPVAPPHTWLLRVGWRRHGLLDPSEVPGGR